MNTISFMLLVIISLCIVELMRGAVQVYRWWRAWKAVEQKRRPPVRMPLKHIDERR